LIFEKNIGFVAKVNPPEKAQNSGKVAEISNK
jgi:hypothetical protein